MRQKRKQFRAIYEVPLRISTPGDLDAGRSRCRAISIPCGDTATA
jgi:hypothetical protein